MRYLMFMVYLFLSLGLKSQECVNLNGSVTDYFNGKGISGVELIVMEGNKVLESQLTLKKGEYEFLLDTGKVYTLEVSKDNMVSIKFIINTKGAFECYNGMYYDMYLQVTLFKKIEGFNFDLFQIPIAMSSYKKSIRNMTWETEYTHKIRPTLEKTMSIYEKTVNRYYLRSDDLIPIVKLDNLFDTIPDDIKSDVIKIVESNIESALDRKLDYNIDKSIYETESSLGLFFTVQIGVYTKYTDLKKIFKISTLNSELLSDGKIRYTSGRFVTDNTAEAYRKEIVRLGIKDAFITAYYEGKRIKIEEANRLISEIGTDILLK